MERGARTMTSFPAYFNTHHTGGDQPIPFPAHQIPCRNIGGTRDRFLGVIRSHGLPDRRMYQLARALRCLGHFDSEGDAPRAA
jgi:hypothetical protein